MGDEKTLPPFPVDDDVLDAVEHSLQGVLTYDEEHRPPGADDDGPWLIGAEYQLATLLDFYSGHDPTHDVLEDGDEELAALGLGGPLVYVNEDPHYTEHDVIAALIAEVRRLRAGSEPGRSR